MSGAHVSSIAAINELLQEIEPGARTLRGQANHLPVFLRAFSLAIASRFNSVQNSALTGMGSPELSPSSSRVSNRSLARRSCSWGGEVFIVVTCRHKQERPQRVDQA